jgi:outer membrane lipoprotein-sorting protein
VLRVFLAVLLWASAAQAMPLTAADTADIAKIEAYLNSFRTMKSRFLQISASGATAEGTAWISRPGKLRFEYDPPSPLLLIVGYGVGFFIDSKLGQTNNFPVQSSPLSILLADKIQLGSQVEIDAIDRLPGQIQITLHRAKASDEGSITLVFATAPLALRSWTVIDAQRNETRVSLFRTEFGGVFDNKMFTYTEQGGTPPTR